jgi:hypothetical protein
MNCKRAVSILDAYVDGELGASERAELDAHLQGCACCEAELRQIEGLTARAKALEAEEPAGLRSRIQDRLAGSPRGISTGIRLKEVFSMKARWGVAAIAAVALISVGVVMSGGSAQAALTRMKRAVTEVNSAHLTVEVRTGDLPFDIKDDHEDRDVDIDIEDVASDGTINVEFWAQDDRWRVNGPMGMKMFYKAGTMTTMMGDQVMGTAKVSSEDVPEKITDFLFKQFTDAMTEAKEHANFRFVGTVNEGDRILRQLEITPKEQDTDIIRVMYFVDEETDLPARLQVWQKGSAEPFVTVNCEFNERYPDELFVPGGDKP